ncbi:kinase-like domain-containing protein [Dichotomocladium elegans]|nr:kinase-like domain-containing protein [Dichotomocladium elegans]
MATVLSTDAVRADQRQQQHIHISQQYHHRQSMPPRKHRFVGNYLLGKTIGRGASGRVKIGIHRYTGEKVAIKMIQRKTLAESSSMSHCVQREAAILQLVHHPNIVHLEHVFQDRQTVYFVMEYVQGGELFDILSRKGRMAEPDARNLFSQLTAALSWCHAHHICHRDLKPENILLDKNKKHLKIADFGIAAIQPPDRLLRSSCGSPHYASPEIIKGMPYYGPATDIWSCGVILYAMLTGYLPFEDTHVGGLMSKIKTGRYAPLPDSVSPEAKDLVRSMLVVDPSRRISLDAVLAHPWLTGKCFLGTDLRFPDALAFSSYRDNALSPLHDRALVKPLSTDALDGRTWETLKVIWRHYSQEELTAALANHGPNVPKLTCHLLIQRAWRENQGIASAHSSCSSEDDDDSMPTTPPPDTLPFSCANIRRQSNHTISARDAAMDAPCSDWTPPCSPLPASNVPRRMESLTSRRAPASQQAQIPKIKCLPSNATASTSIERRARPCVLTPQKGADTMTARYSHVQATASTAELGHDNAMEQLQAMIGRSTTPRKGWLNTLLGMWRTCPRSSPELMRDVTGSSISIFRHAKHEYEAAGKLHQVLKECFEGELSGRVYPAGELIWTGSMKSSIPQSPRKQEFRCSIHASTEADAKSVVVRFFPVKKDPSYSLQLIVKRIVAAWNQYDAEADEVAKANGWSS